MQLQLKTITPIHIGNGEELSPLDYIFDGKFYYRITQNQFVEFIKDIPEGVEKFVEWAEERAKEIIALQNREREFSKNRRDYNQELSYLKESFNYLKFAELHGQESAFIEYLQNNTDIPKVPFKGKEIKGQVRGAMKTATQQVYLPGTSLKGAIRTALLYHFLQNKADQNTIKEILERNLQKAKASIQKGGKTRKIQANFADELEQLAFYGAWYNPDDKKRPDKIKRNDEKFDIMKFLFVSDGRIAKAKEALGIEKVGLFLVAKQPQRGRKGTVLQATQQGQTPFVETINQNTSIESRIQFNIDFFLQIKDQIQDDAIHIKKEKVWMGLKAKSKNIFNLDIDTLTPENAKTKQKEVYQHIVQCLQTFSQRQIKQDKLWQEDFLDYANRQRQKYSHLLQQGFRDLATKEQSTLLHLGYGTGFGGITEFLHLVDNEDLKKLYKEIMELFLIGDKPGSERRRQEEARKKNAPKQSYVANPDLFPKSRRLLTSDDYMQAMGWIEILNIDLPSTQPRGATSGTAAPTSEPSKIQEPEYFNKPLNPKKANTYQIKAIVTHSGKPNKVRIWVTEDYTPELDLDNCRNPLPLNTVVFIKPNIDKKKQIRQVSLIKIDK